MSAFRPRFLVAVMTAGLAVLSAVPLAPSPALAATEGSLRARAAVVESQLAAESAALHANALSYVTEKRTYENSLLAEGRTRAHVRSIEISVARQRAMVRSDAITAYVNAASSSPIGLYLDGRPNELATDATYTRVANDQVATTIATLADDEVTLTANLAVEQREVALAAASLAATNRSRTSVLSAVSAEQGALASVNGELASLVRQAEINRERAAAAATAAAAQAAATAIPTASAGPPAAITSIPATVTSVVPTSLASAFATIRRCESSSVYSLNTGNGYYGAYQFSTSTWARLGGSGLASEASPAAQDAAAYKLYESSGWGAWPECAAVAGL